MSEEMTATTVTLAAPDGAAIEAYLARPEAEDRRGGVLVIHHMPGFDRWTKEVVRRIAALGYDTIAPNLYSRLGPGLAPEDAAAAARAAGGVPDDQVVSDARAAIAALRDLPTSNGKVGTIGHCSGGRHAVLVGCTCEVDAVVDCYGAYVTGTPPEGWPVKVTNLVDRLDALRAPLLGLFGSEDQFPTPEHVAELAEILDARSHPHEFHTYEGATHAFFMNERPSFNVEASNDGWERIASFFATNLGG